MKFAAPRSGAKINFTEDHFYLSLLGLVAILVWAVLTLLALLLHRNFLTIACDTADLESAIVNTMHGHWFANNGPGGPNILGSHTTFLLLLVIPFYVVAPYPETLFVLQVAGVCSTVFPLYLVARDLGLRPLIGFVIAATSLISGYIVHMAIAPFHLETWIAAASLWAFHFYLRNNLIGFVISMFTAFCCGEQAALIFIALGVSLLLIKDDCAWRRRYGITALVAGLCWIAFAVCVVNPIAAGNASFNIFAYNYAGWGVKSASGLPGALASSPMRVFYLLFDGLRWYHLLTVVGLLLVTAFFSWRSLLMLLPMPAYLLMSGQEFFLYFHAYYYSFIFVAGYIGLLYFARRVNPAGRGAIVGLTLFWLVAILTLCNASGYYYQLAGGTDEPFSTEIREQFARIPPNATVYGPHRYSVYLSNRENFAMGDMPPAGVDFDTMVEQNFSKTNIHADQIDFIVADFWTDQCGWRRGFMDADRSQARSDAIDRLVASGKWQNVWQQNDVVILQRVAR